MFRHKNEKVNKVLHCLNEERGIFKYDFRIDKDLIDTYNKLYGSGRELSKSEYDLAAKIATVNLLQVKSQVLGLKASKIPEGFIYVVSNPAWPTCVKVGRTIDSKRRLSQMQTYSPFRDYKIEHYTFCSNIAKLEAFIHTKLSKFHIGGEWFSVLPENAIKCIKRFNKGLLV